MNPKSHWEKVYEKHELTEASWYQRQPTRSLEFVAAASAGPDTRIIDVGGGTSTLVDELLDRNLGRVTVLDLSKTALEVARARLGPRAKEVAWLEADVTRTELPANAYDVWHDRAAFHFLTDPQDRQRYVAAAIHVLPLGATLIIATFAADGPTRCSGLDVARYDTNGLALEFGPEFELLRGLRDVHRTPAGTEQAFTYAVLRRR